MSKFIQLLRPNLRIQYANLWPHSGIRSCYHQSLHAFTSGYDRTLLGHTFSLHRRCFCMRYYHFCNVNNNCYKQHNIINISSYGNPRESTQHTAVEMFTLIIKHTNMHTGIKITVCIDNTKTCVSCNG